jgi:antitoxin component of MazEF toxin-antitoxin module
VREDGSLALPDDLYQTLGLEPGTEVEMEITTGGCLLVRPPDGLDPEQWLYRTPKWQEGEREIEEEIAAGLQGEVYLSTEEFLAALEAHMHDSQD